LIAIMYAFPPAFPVMMCRTSGATADQFMEHLALWEGDGTGKPETVWLEPVTDEQYNGPRTNSR
jgi:hypothetical protein